MSALSSAPEFLRASEHVKALGGIPSILPRTIRGIRNAASLFARKGGAELHEALAGVVELVLRAPTNSSVIVAAVAELHPLHFADNSDFSPLQLTRFLGPDETIAVLALSFLTRRLSAVSSPECWDFLVPRLRQHVALGRALGSFQREMGTGQGMLLAGLPVVALGTMLASDPTIGQRYLQRRGFGGETPPQRLFDRDQESHAFGCCSLHGAICLARALGIAPTLLQMFTDVLAASPTIVQGAVPPVSLLAAIDEALSLPSVEESLRSSKSPPLCTTHPSPLSAFLSRITPEPQRAEIEGMINNIRTNTEVSDWLFAVPAPTDADSYHSTTTDSEMQSGGES